MSQPSTDSTITTSRSPDAISRRAYEIWEREGRPEGADLRHWLQAEQELGVDSGSAGSDSSPSSSAHNLNTDRPLQGTRSTATPGRESRRNSGSPFASEKNGSKRKPAMAL